ncbi:MAG: DUF1028 domain-containing protein [bacterium]|nr:DUF1028 domain-containing protein [bacterium]
MTFSIVAYDPNEHAWGVAVASKFLAVASVVSWAQAGAGAVATQSYAKVSYGADGLALMREGMTAADTLAALTSADEGREMRQVGIVDAHGNAVTYTGAKCYAWAGGKTGEGFACQGNILTGADVIDAMADVFAATSGELADRLVAALAAGDAAGGDSRGRQGAGVLVVKAGGGYGGDNDRYLDLRVDDDPAPVGRLAAMVRAHHVFFGQPRPEDQLPVDESIARELQAMMQIGGYWRAEVNGVWDETAKAAFDALVGSENLEERWRREDPDKIDRVALDYLRERYKG